MKKMRTVAVGVILALTLVLFASCSGRTYDDTKALGQLYTISDRSSQNSQEVNETVIKQTEHRQAEADNSGNTDSGNDNSGNTDNTDTGNTDTGNDDTGNTDNGNTDNTDTGNTDNGDDNTDDEYNGGSTDDRDYSTTCMSFNVLAYDTHNVGYDTPEVRLNYIESTINKYDADLIGTQELMGPHTNNAGYDSVKELTKRLSSKYGFCSALDDKGFTLSALTIGSGLVIFYRLDRFEVKDRGCKVYSNDANRHYQWVKFFDKQENVTIFMTNTHFSINPSGDSTAGQKIRNQQAGELLNFWKNNCGEKFPLYATGDYNHRKTEAAYATLSSSNFVSSRDVAQTNSGDSSIDFIYINNSVQGCYRYYEVVDTFEPAGVPATGLAKYKASDHNAIVAYCYNDM